MTSPAREDQDFPANLNQDKSDSAEHGTVLRKRQGASLARWWVCLKNLKWENVASD
jgi:hypothetical protein